MFILNDNIFMIYKFLGEKIDYDGTQLSPHWIYKNFGLQGDAMIAFCGAADVKLTEMVDIEDVLNDEPIYSENMLHFIEEKFNVPLIGGILRQRMLVVTAKEAIEEMTGKSLIRHGDDLYFDDKKLSVSIATCSLNSTLIHFAMNVTSDNTPIPTSGLISELGLHNIKELAERILMMYTEEMKHIYLASCKVRGV